MQGGRDPFFGFGDPFGSFGGFGDPFGSFGGFGDPFGSFGGFGGQRSLISNFFGGTNPFDDPFFRRPIGSMSESSYGGPFMDPRTSGFLEHQPTQPNLSRGPVIEELNSDDEKDEKENGKEKKENPRKHGRSSKEPVIEDPDEVTEKRSKYMPCRNDINQMQHVRSQPQMHSFTFQSSSVSYGGANGTYHTTSSARRTGTDGLTFEEFKEADSSTRQATHMVSRGIYDKGHSVTRNLKSDGHVDTMQTLHNLNEDELVGFEEAWKGNARKHLPGWNGEFANRDVIGSGRDGHDRGGWALPSNERPNYAGGSRPQAGPPQHSRARSNKSGSTSQGNRRY